MPKPITETDLFLSFLLVFFAGLISFVFRLKLEKSLAWATLRTTVQLFLIGFVLKILFESEHLLILSLVVLVMLSTATQAALKRAGYTFSYAFLFTFITFIISGLLITHFSTHMILNIEPWYEPRYFIPLLGMVLGNSLNGISLCLNSLLQSFSLRKDEIEANLALGATRWEAAKETLQEAIRIGMIPIINSMMVVGLVSLPGMMTGQILAGVPPLEAIKYQILIMFMIAATTSLACILITLFSFRRLFNHKHQLLSQLIVTKK